MVADSCSSRGMVCRPARIEMPKNGRPRHVLTMMIETMAMVGVPSQDGPVVASPLTTSRRLNRPMPGSRIHCHATVLSTVGTMNGSSSMARVRAFIRKFWFITRAMPNPPAAFIRVATAVNLIVLPTDCQKIGSFERVTKLPRPTKEDRKSTRLNSSHGYISYAVFCLKKKKKKNQIRLTDQQDIYARSQCTSLT